MGEVNGPPPKAVEFPAVQAWEQITSDAASSEGLKRTSKEVAEKRHPASHEADFGRKQPGDVSSFSRSIGDRPHKLTIDVADRQQHERPECETEQRAQWPAPLQKVVHDDQPGG